MNNIINFPRRDHPSRPSVRRESRNGMRRRLCDAARKIPHLREQPTRVDPLHPPTATHHDHRDIHHTKAINHAIAARDADTITDLLGNAAGLEADHAASEDELKALNEEHDTRLARQRTYEGKVEAEGLGQELCHSPRWPKWLAKAVAAIFETIAFATPMQLVGAVDFGGSATSQQRVGTLLALAMGAAYALMMTFLADGLGSGLKRRRYRHILERDTSHIEAEGWPRPATTTTDDRTLVAAAVALLLSLFAAGVIRADAIRILAGAGQSQVTVSWTIFFLLTAGVFTAVAAVAYWTTRPLADEKDRLRASADETGTQIDAKRRECYRLAGRLEHCEAEIEKTAANSSEEQLGQYELVAGQIRHRQAHNPHIYGPTAPHVPVQDVLEHPEKHVRPPHRASVAKEVRSRIQRTRDHVAGKTPADEQGEAA